MDQNNNSKKTISIRLRIIETGRINNYGKCKKKSSIFGVFHKIKSCIGWLIFGVITGIIGAVIF